MDEAVTSTTGSPASVTTELAMRRTGVSFQRTRMAADRTLMAVIRTGLSLISFGFTISTFFNKLKEAQVLKSAAATRNFGEWLVLLGIGMLILGIICHVLFMLGLRSEREALKAAGMVRAKSVFPVSLVLIVPVLLMLLGIAAALSMFGRTGPLQE